MIAYDLFKFCRSEPADGLKSSPLVVPTQNKTRKNTFISISNCKKFKN